MSEATKPNVPPAVYMVADNLDAVLAAGEDLLALVHHDDGGADPRAAASADRTFADRVRTLEMTIAARALQARARARDLRTADHRYRALIDLFIAGTAVLQDAVDDLGDSTTNDFHSGGDIVTFLRGRAVIAADAAGLRHYGDLAVSEHFLVAERIEIGPLMDLCATFLDRLEDHYELYDGSIVDAPAAPPAGETVVAAE